MSVDTEEMKVRGSTAAVIRRGRAAQRLYEGFTQQQVDDVVAGVAWAIAQPDRARELAEVSVRETGMGKQRTSSLRIVARQRVRSATLPGRRPLGSSRTTRRQGSPNTPSPWALLRQSARLPTRRPRRRTRR
jgi:hypothetical protein